MDGGARQQEMAHDIKQEIKTMARRSRDARQVNRAGKKIASIENASDGSRQDPLQLSRISPRVESSDNGPTDSIDGYADTVVSSRAAEGQPPGLAESHSCTEVESQAIPSLPFDAVYSMFFLDHLFWFLYPFYKPSVQWGGRAWILELMTTSAPFKQTVLRYSGHFHPLVWPAESCLNAPAQLAKFEDPFTTLSRSLQTLLGVSKLGEHARCACRVLTSIVQIHRYEISTSNFSNWKTHLDAATTLFTQLLSDCSGTISFKERSRFSNVLRSLDIDMLMTDQGNACTMKEAFVFSASLILFDDIVAAATLRQIPRLYEYHEQLLGDNDPDIDLEGFIGIKSSVLRYLGEVTVLDAKKQEDQAAGTLDGMALAQQAVMIKSSLTSCLNELQESNRQYPKSQTGNRSCLHEFQEPHHSHATQQDTCLVSQAWTHATIIYLITVVSGWQPANAELRDHVEQLVQLLKWQIPPPLIRTVVWPFCVAGCLAGPHQARLLHEIASILQPTGVFPTVQKSVDIMEWVWQQGSGHQTGDQREPNQFDLSSCFRSQKELPLLV